MLPKMEVAPAVEGRKIKERKAKEKRRKKNERGKEERVGCKVKKRKRKVECSLRFFIFFIF